jgi:DNA-binding response OmpR family regulator
MQASTPPTAFIAEDDDLIAHLLQLLLERAGYAVHAVRDGRAARDFIEGQPAPDVALLDVMMPFHDGVELVRRMRAQPGWERVPALMLTSRSDEADIVEALEAGANDYVIKPFQPNELMARVRRFVQGATQ